MFFCLFCGGEGWFVSFALECLLSGLHCAEHAWELLN